MVDPWRARMAPASDATRLKGHHSLGRKAAMNTQRWLSVAAVTIASATLALAGAGLGQPRTMAIALWLGA